MIGHRQASLCHGLAVTADPDPETLANAPRPKTRTEITDPVGTLAPAKSREWNQDRSQAQSAENEAKDQDGSRQYAQEAHAFQAVFH